MRLKYLRYVCLAIVVNTVIIVGLHLTRVLRDVMQENAEHGNSESSMQRDSDKDIIRYTDVVSCDSPSARQVYRYETLLTLVTTMKDIPEKRTVHSNTLKNWSKLMPKVQPVLYKTSTTTNELVEEAESLGWYIRDAPETNPDGLPVLSKMMADADKTFDSEFIGYSNGDILYSNGIIKTLNSMLYYINSKTEKNIVIIGVRTRFDVRGVSDTITDPFLLGSIAKEKHGVYLANAEDYFVTVKNGFPWHCIPPFVVGRMGWDNWLVSNANRWGFSVIDCSNTLLAVHQSDFEGDFPCMRAPNTDLNLKLIPNYNLVTGLVTCAHSGTVNDMNGDICIMQRNCPRHCGTLDPNRKPPSESECTTNRYAQPIAHLGPPGQVNQPPNKVINEEKIPRR